MDGIQTASSWMHCGLRCNEGGRRDDHRRPKTTIPVTPNPVKHAGRRLTASHEPVRAWFTRSDRRGTGPSDGARRRPAIPSGEA